MRKNLVLTGMMGVGKSTLGAILSKKLSLPFIDIDKIIEETEGNSINLIFKKKSEQYFRKLESDITLDILKKKTAVIALGGGAFLNKLIRNEVKNTSISFWIDVSKELLVKRLNKTNKRPLLLKKNLSETINKIYLERKKFYSEADHRILCNFLKADEIVKRIIRHYENTRNKT